MDGEGTPIPIDPRKSLEEVLDDLRNEAKAEVAKNLPAVEGDHPESNANLGAPAKPVATGYVKEGQIK